MNLPFHKFSRKKIFVACVSFTLFYFEYPYFSFINEIFETQKLSGGMFFIESCNQIIMTLSVFTNCFKREQYDVYYDEYLFSQIASNKREQKHLTRTI